METHYTREAHNNPAKRFPVLQEAIHLQNTVAEHYYEDTGVHFQLETALAGDLSCMRSNLFIGAMVDAEKKKWHKQSVYLCGTCINVKKLQAAEK